VWGRTTRPLTSSAFALPFGVRAASLVILLILWEFSAWAMSSPGVAHMLQSVGFEPRSAYDLVRNRIYFPAPGLFWLGQSLLAWLSGATVPPSSTVLEAFWQAATTTSGLTKNQLSILGYRFTTADLWFNIYQTLYRATLAFVIAMVVGSVIGIALGRMKALNRFFDGWVLLGLNMPALVIGILCYIWLGLNDLALVVAVIINKIPLVAITTREGAAAVQPDLLHVARAFRLSPLTTLRRVFLPQMYPYFMVAARNGIALIWKIVLVYELLGRSNGVGFMLANSFSELKVGQLLAYALAFIGVVMLIEALIVRPMERRATKWRM
jgi:ABC-type nitrate/sulfonate/bicarbonate transport system permease component